MTEQIILAAAIVLAVLVLVFEVVETWRWRGSKNRPASRFAVVRFVRRIPSGVIGLITLRPLRHRRPKPDLSMPSEDVARRLGQPVLGPVHVQPQRIVVSGARRADWAVAPTAVVPPVPQRSSRPSRIRLVRDTLGAAFVLVGFVVAFANFLPVKAGPDGGVLAATGTPGFTPVIVTPQPADSPVAVAPATPAPTPTATPTPTEPWSWSRRPQARLRPRPRPSRRQPGRPRGPPRAHAGAAPRPRSRRPGRPRNPRRSPPPQADPDTGGQDYGVDRPWERLAARGYHLQLQLPARQELRDRLRRQQRSRISGTLGGNGSGSRVLLFLFPGSYTAVLTVFGSGGSSGMRHRGPSMSPRLCAGFAAKAP